VWTSFPLYRFTKTVSQIVGARVRAGLHHAEGLVDSNRSEEKTVTDFRYHRDYIDYIQKRTFQKNQNIPFLNI
jgi:hypothetical protein